MSGEQQTSTEIRRIAREHVFRDLAEHAQRMADAAIRASEQADLGPDREYMVARHAEAANVASRLRQSL